MLVGQREIACSGWVTTARLGWLHHTLVMQTCVSQSAKVDTCATSFSLLALLIYMGYFAYIYCIRVLAVQCAVSRG